MKIVPGKCIGSINIGMNIEQVKTIININSIQELPHNIILKSDNIKIWINKSENKVTQILACKDFKGNYKGICIGATLEEIQNHLKLNYYEYLDCYYLEGISGICFELGDSGDNCYWDEKTAPIETICVF